MRRRRRSGQRSASHGRGWPPATGDRPPTWARRTVSSRSERSSLPQASGSRSLARHLPGCVDVPTLRGEGPRRVAAGVPGHCRVAGPSILVPVPAPCPSPAQAQGRPAVGGRPSPGAHQRVESRHEAVKQRRDSAHPLERGRGRARAKHLSEAGYDVACGPLKDGRMRDLRANPPTRS